MGANLQILSFATSIKTVEQARADFEKRAEQDRYENGHSYSGSYGMLGRLTLIGGVFSTVDAFEDYLEDKGKNDGYLAQVHVIRETEPLKKAAKEMFYAKRDVDTVDGGRLYSRDNPYKFETVKPTPALKRRLAAKLEKAKMKHRKLLDAQIAKSKTTRFVAGGWVSE